MKINLKHWKVSLPVFPPELVMDNSVEQAYTDCPRYGFYRYGLRRGFTGVSWVLQYGTAYHKYREVLEKLMIASGVEGTKALTMEVHTEAMDSALKGWVEPPEDHDKGFLNRFRLIAACTLAFGRIQEERRSGRIIVTRSEEPLDLEYDWMICPVCNWTSLDGELKNFAEDGTPLCSKCNSPLARARHGGLVDQFTIFSSLNNALMVRDFKTTTRMGKTYNQKFDPNSQIQGYVWDGTKLAGRKFEGAIIETVYNVKSKKLPEIHQTYVTYSKGQQEQWEASRMIERQLIHTMWSRVEELGYLAFPQRTNHCPEWGGCLFREACISGSAYEIEQFLLSSTIESHWDFMARDAEESRV